MGNLLTLKHDNLTSASNSKRTVHETSSNSCLMKTYHLYMHNGGFLPVTSTSTLHLPSSVIIPLLFPSTFLMQGKGFHNLLYHGFLFIAYVNVTFFQALASTRGKHSLNYLHWIFIFQQVNDQSWLGYIRSANK